VTCKRCDESLSSSLCIQSLLSYRGISSTPFNALSLGDRLPVSSIGEAALCKNVVTGGVCDRLKMVVPLLSSLKKEDPRTELDHAQAHVSFSAPRWSFTAAIDG
jgi:hypothetical protein